MWLWGPWVKYYLLDIIIKYIFYFLTFGDIWIQFVALLTYFVFLMNYLHTNVHISEFSKKCVYSNPYFFGDLAFMRIIFFHLPPYIRGSNKYFSKWDCLPNAYFFEKDSHQISSTHKYLLVLGIHFKKLLFICVYFKWVINIQFLKSMPSTHI